MGAEVFSGNIAVCPNCHTSFAHDKVNGVALVSAIADIDARKRMRCKLALDDIEDLGLRKELKFIHIKKIFLDSFNDFNRDIQRILGLDEGVE